MSCCGKKRATISNPLSSTTILSKHPDSNPVVWFQYTGANALTVIGRATSMSYRFPHPGAVLAADMRDSITLAAVPNLQRVNEPRK
jgi:hypothetical protein